MARFVATCAVMLPIAAGLGQPVARAQTALNDHAYPMRFATRSGLEAKSPHCVGCTVVVGQGVITSGTDAQLRAFVKRWGGDPAKAVLRLHSPGGDLIAALHLGKAIRRAGFQTEALSSRPCQSACTLAFAGGVARAAQRNGLAVHDMSVGSIQGTNTRHRQREIAQGSPLRQILLAAVRDHLDLMGMSQRLVDQAAATPSHRMDNLNADDLAALNITHIPHRR
ncbi:MAG: hypothetical protein AAGD23_08825 [Pseudomonadota bacterium]